MKLKNLKILVRVSSRWSAGATPADRKIRRERMQKSFDRDRKKLMRRDPDGLDGTFSGTQNVGGYALANYPVGIDLEPTNRKVSDRVFKRLGNARERRLAKEALYLWVMKEAAFKALKGPHQPLVISQVRILKAAPTRSARPPVRGAKKALTFSFKSYKSSGLGSIGFGELLISKRYILGLAVIYP